MHEALLFDTLPDQQVRCRVCCRRCVVGPGHSGYCGTRKNQLGVLYSLIYGRVSSLRVSPIEIKPLFHYYPGSQWLSLGSLGCNFLCPGCQNWEIAHARAEESLNRTRSLSPMEAVRLALEQGCKGISWTYNEPTLWVEYTLDTAKIAKQKGLLTNYVTNAYMTPEALDRMGPLLDAYRADVKGFCDATYRRIADVPDFKTILRTVERARHRWDMHVEIITNLIPGINDEEGELGDLASWIRDELGPDTPWHVTRFHPHLRLSHLSPTPVPQLERAREIGLKTGLKYVYLGNVPGRNAENTFCPGCGRLLIERFNFRILQYDLSGDRCPSCGQVIAGCFDTRGPESTSLG